MTGIPVSTGGPPQDPRAGIADALAQAQTEQAPQSSQEQPTEVQARIMRIEDLLIERGVATEGDFTGEIGTDDQGQPVEPPPEAMAEGERPQAPQEAPPA